MTPRERVTTLVTDDAPVAAPAAFAAPLVAPLADDEQTSGVDIVGAMAPPSSVKAPGEPGPALDSVEPAPRSTRDPKEPFDAAALGAGTHEARRDPSQAIVLDTAVSATVGDPQGIPPVDAPPPNPGSRFDSETTAGATRTRQDFGRSVPMPPSVHPLDAAQPSGAQPYPDAPPPNAHHQGGPHLPAQTGPYHVPGQPQPGEAGRPQHTTMSSALGVSGMFMIGSLALGFFAGGLSLTLLFIAWIFAMNIQTGRRWLQFSFLAGFGVLGFIFFTAISQQMFSPFDAVQVFARWVCLILIPCTVAGVWHGMHAASDRGEGRRR